MGDSFMKSNISGIASAQRQVPHCAVVFYANGHDKNVETQFATYHSVRESAGRFDLAPGSPLTGQNLQKIAKMAAEGLRHKVEIIPENVVAITDDLLVWWMPAGQQQMHFDVSMGSEAVDRKRLQGVGGKCPVPALVFVLQRRRAQNAAYNGISVFALAENKRPGASTALFRAPLLNIDEQGSVCWGNGAMPKGRTVADISAWQSLFFSSVFTHFNGSSPIKGKDCYGFIADLLESAATDFPIDRLIPMNRTLQKVVDSLSGDRNG